MNITISSNLFERQSLHKVIKRISSFLEYFDEIKAQNSAESLLNQFVGLLESIVSERCPHIYSRGRNKGSKCLKARWLNPTFELRSDRCGSHTSKSFKQEYTPIVSESKKTPPKKKSKNTPNNNFSNTAADDSSLIEQIDASKIDWGQASIISTPKSLVKEYYSNESDLSFLYDDFYLDRSGTIAQRNPDTASVYKWVLIKKYSRDNKVFRPFSVTVLEELKKQKRLQDYNYIINQTVPIDLKKVIEATKSKQETTTNDQEKTPDQTPKSIVQAPPKLTLQTEAEKIDKFRAYSRAPKVVIYEDDYMDSTELAQLTRKQEAEKARIQAEKKREQTAKLYNSHEIETGSNSEASSEKDSVESVSDASLGSEERQDPIYQEWLVEQNKGLTRNPYGEEYRPTMEFPGCDFDEDSQ